MVDNKIKLMIGAGIVIVGIVIGICLLGVIAYYTLGFNKVMPVAGHELTIKVGNGTVSDATLIATKDILRARFGEYGSIALASTMRDDQGNAYVTINYGNIPYDEAASLTQHQGKFEIRIQTQGNDSAYILDGNDVQAVSEPVFHTDTNGQTAYGVTFSLTKTGAEKFQQVCIQYGATTDPDNHYIMMFIDDKMFHSRPMSAELANSLKTQQVDTMIAMTGTGDDGKLIAKFVSIFLRTGPLPVKTEIVE